MNSTLLDRLRAFQIPAAIPLPSDHTFVARLKGIDFEGILNSPELGFTRPFDARFAKLMIRTASHLLGGDAGGRFGFAEQTEFSVLLDRRVSAQWADASDLQCFLVGLASTRLSALAETEALFTCQLFAFTTPELAVSYFGWRQQEANTTALNTYCTFVLSQKNSAEEVSKLLEGLGPLEKEEILRQNDIEYCQLPAWQRYGAGVHLVDGGGVAVDTNLPRDDAYGPYVQQYID